MEKKRKAVEKMEMVGYMSQVRVPPSHTHTHTFICLQAYPNMWKCYYTQTTTILDTSLTQTYTDTHLFAHIHSLDGPDGKQFLFIVVHRTDCCSAS